MADDDPRVMSQGLTRRGFLKGVAVASAVGWPADVPSQSSSGRRGAASTPRKPLSTLQFAVPRRDKPPHLDGHIVEEEWSRSCSITGFIDLDSKQFSHRQGVAWLGYDAAHLWFAYRSFFPPGTQEGGAWDEKALRTFAHKRDGSVFLDDSLEIFLAPEDPARYIQFIVNSTGTINDRRDGDIGWDGDWHIRSRVDDEAGIWELEGGISFASLGVPAPATGDTWYCNIARNWKGLENRLTSLTGEYRKQMARILFVGDGPAIHERSWGKPLSDQPALDLMIGGQKRNVRVDVNWEIQHEGDDERIEEGTRTLLVSERSRHHLQNRLTSHGIGSYSLVVTAQESADGAVLYQRVLPYSVEPPITLHPYFVLKTATLGVLIDLRRIPLPLPDLRHADLVVHADSRVLVRTSMRPVQDDHFGVEFDSQVHEGQRLTLSCKVEGKDGAPFEASCDYRIPETPVWLGNYEPPTDFVPWPWEPLKVAPATRSVSCWNRIYEFGDHGLPDSVRVGGRELLAAPMVLQVKADGQEVRWAPGREREISSTPATATVETRGRAGSMDVGMTTTVEFDGYAESRLTLTPRGPTEVADIRVEIPLRPEAVRFFHLDGQWGDRLFGDIEERADFPALDREGHYRWLGDDDTGFCWLAEGIEEWPSWDRPRIGFDRTGDRWVGYLQFVGSPTTMSAPITFGFGYQATPTRPAPDRPVRAFTSYNTPPEKLDLPVSRIGDTVLEMSLAGKMNYPPFPEDEEKIRAWIAGHRAKGMKFVGYQYIDAGTETDAYQMYWGDWVSSIPAETRQWRTLTAKCCLDSSWSDYTCWILDTMMSEYDTDGVYLDGLMARACRRGKAHDHPTPNTWPMGAARAHLKKLLYVARKRKGAASVLFGHVSLGTIAPVAGLLDLGLKGENYGSPLGYDALTAEVLRAEFGRQWGPPTVLLPQLTKKQAIPTSRLIGWAALHGVDCAPSFLPEDEREIYLFGTWSAMEAFRIDTADFLPYWKQELFREAAGRPVSLYARFDEGRYLLVITNQTQQAATYQIVARSDLSIIGVQERLTQGTLSQAGDTIVARLDGWGYRLLEVAVSS